MQRRGWRVGRVWEVQEEKFGRGRGQEGRDVRGREVVDAFEIPDGTRVSILLTLELRRGT